MIWLNSYNNSGKSIKILEFRSTKCNEFTVSKLNVISDECFQTIHLNVKKISHWTEFLLLNVRIELEVLER